MHKIILIIIAVVFLGCGSSRKDWVDYNCTEAGGFELGQKDARSGRVFDTNVLRKCPEDKVEVARKAYLDGFKSAGGKMSTSDEKYLYGQDILQDLVHAINKNPDKKKNEEKPKEEKSKDENTTVEKPKEEKSKVEQKK